MTIEDARAALDATIDNARGQNFKAIHVAEILHRDRTSPGGLDLRHHEAYRCASKHWRDEVCERLVGATSRSNGTWQDTLFSQAKTPVALAVLGAENRRLNGAVEAYIYRRVGATQAAIAELADELERPCKRPFSLAELLRHCRADAALRRVVERIYEIAAFAVIDTLVQALGVEVIVQVPAKRLALLDRDDRFLATVLRAAASELPLRLAGRLTRVGVVNAADGGVDLIANFGFRAQVRHAVFNDAQVRTFFGRPANPAQTLICRSAVVGHDDDAVARNMAARVISETDLIRWSDLIASGRFGPDVGNALRARIAAELRCEFPGCRSDAFLAFMRERGYDAMPTWKTEAEP